MTAEQSIIACLLINQSKTLYYCRRDGLAPEAFTDADCRAVYAVAVEMANKPDNYINMLTIAHACKAKGLSVKMEVFENAIDKIASIEECPGYTKIVKTAYIKRKTTELMRGYIDAIQENSDVNECISQMIAELLSVSTGSDIAINNPDHYRKEKMEQWTLAKNKGFVGIPSEFPLVNQWLGGYRRGVMAIIGAYRGTGKSTLLAEEALAMAKKGYKVAMFTLEDPADIVSARMAGNESGVSVYFCDIGTAYDSQLEEINKAWKTLAGLPLFISQNAYSLADITSAAQYLKDTKGLDIMMIDHIQYITPQQLPHMNRNGTIGVYSQGLATLAKKLDCSVLVASQLSRDCEKDNRTPRLSDLRDSGTLEADARQVMLLYKMQNGLEPAYVLEIAKNNYGISGKRIQLSRQDGKQRFLEIGEYTKNE